MVTETVVPSCVRCQLCSAVCKRGVRLACCGGIACRSCATKVSDTHDIARSDQPCTSWLLSRLSIHIRILAADVTVQCRK